ncbi:DUF2232 domain-containing protein [Geovibrio thiophilus]|uniref:DUF2232 domain-containing protein n=1 Tax=Geovibrio thiophilus TaxID=139438 RepID=A0A3R5UZL3_9BACT|nr:DUF2232 domain-containing protein [Geovibrio thiophilus]QAR32160.1 DUF2232 domain-containing protein [Geovibrio thiophilus]
MRVFYLPVASIALFAAVLFFPRVGGLFIPFSPLLLLLYLAEPAREKISDILFLVLVGLCAAFEPFISAYYAMTVIFTAFMIYRWQNKPESNWLPVAASPIPAFILSAVFVFFTDSMRSSLTENVTEILKVLVEAAKKAPETGAASYAAVVEKNMDLAALSLVLIFPGIIFLTSVLVAYFTKTFFYKIKKQEHEVFRLPDNLVWVMLAGLAFFFMGDVYMRSVAFNTLLVFGGLYFIQGFEVLRRWVHRFRLAGIFKAVIYIIIFSEPPLMLALALVGLFSIWFNFFGKPKQDETGS